MPSVPFEKMHGNRELVLMPSLIFDDAENLPKNLFELEPILQSILLNRGLKSEQDFAFRLNQLLPFHTMKGIDEACELLFLALKKQSRLLIIGDFDADGATSTAIGLKGLRDFGFENLDYLVPDRFKFGYGLSAAIVEVALDYSPDIIITVDNGISSHEGISLAREHGIQVIVTDHHLPGKTLPRANVIVNPNQPDCAFPSKNLAGVGVVFYVLIALRAYLRDRNYFIEQQLIEPNLAQLLDIVALGTVADIVPLDANNRLLVQQGLARIRMGKACFGIQALLSIAKKNPLTIKSSDFGFAIGPRLNAAGRLDSMSAGIECLLSDNLNDAAALAEQLNDFNEDRKKIESAMKDEALALLPDLSSSKDKQALICLFDSRWHQGVVGIVASRLKEKYHLPSIIFAQDDNAPELLKGSARSIPGLHIRDLLDQFASKHPKLLKKFGGHAMAAGMSIRKADFNKFSNLLNVELQLWLSSLALSSEDILRPKIMLDGSLSQMHFSLEFAKKLQSFEPWGQGFSEPLFIGLFIIEKQRVLSGKHLKMTLILVQEQQHLSASQQQEIDAIAFNVEPEYMHYESQKVNLIYKLDINEFRGVQSLQLMVEHIIPLT